MSPDDTPSGATPHPSPDITIPETDASPHPLAPARWDWTEVRRVLVVRLRSIGDAVLATPALHALRRFLPHAEIDLLLEDWVAPLLENSPDVDRVVTVERDSLKSRIAVWRTLRAARYDVAYDLHGGSTASLLTWASGARHTVGYASYGHARLLKHTAPPSSGLWGRDRIHSAEQQLGLVGWTGVPVTDLPVSRVSVSEEARSRVAERLRLAGIHAGRPVALFHPAAAFATKTWDSAHFARVADRVSEQGFAVVAVAAPHEAEVLSALSSAARRPLVTFDDLPLPELAALAERAGLFVGNDSGVAHIAAALGVPSVVVFGSSNVTHWRPWTRAPSEVVREELPCAPCPGYTCSEFAQPECIRRVPAERVMDAVGRVLAASEGARKRFEKRREGES
ncbi:MAG TPA: glycosyltransferase family 9 protein [Pyrinomonadaceae bacterium]|nr:glycosyltransferase family 9 protein [Pyrinomonadaceae bacterium]